jgi:hypothetical protein
VKWKATKLRNRKLAPSTVPASELKTIYAVRTLGEERKLGQYKLVDGGNTKYFNNFLELKYYSDKVLYHERNYVVLVKGQAPDDLC